LTHGYWGYRDPEQAIHDMFGAESARQFGFADALAAEDQGSPGQVLRWAGWVQIPPPARAIVEVACAEAGPTGYFDEVEVASATCPPDGTVARRTITLYARRRGGRIHFRMTGARAAAPGAAGSPLGPTEAYALLCGPRAQTVARAIERVLAIFAGQRPPDAPALASRADEWLPRAASRFYDFAPIEHEVRREVIAQVLRNDGPTRP